MGQHHTQLTCLERKTHRLAARRRPATQPQPETADLRSQAEDLLRDLALVYHLTRRVKQSILEEKTSEEDQPEADLQTVGSL